MGLNCSKPKPEVIPEIPKVSMLLTLKDLMAKNNFIHGKLLLNGECLATMEPCEHPDCLYISPNNLDIIELGSLDAYTINRALKTGVFAEYYKPTPMKNVGFDEIIAHFQI